MKKNLILFLLFITSNTIAQQMKGMGKPAKGIAPAGTERRIALVIGNKDYINPSDVLTNPVNDANDMSRILEELGFKVITYTNLNQKNMKKAIDAFGEKLVDFDMALVYYSGHGSEYGGENYLIPVDASLLSETDIKYDGIPLGQISDKMSSAKVRTSIIILDACRSLPSKKSNTKGEIREGLTIPHNPAGSIIVYATRQLEVAYDDSKWNNSLFTKELIKHLPEVNLSLSQILTRTRNGVYQLSNEKQLPTDYSSLLGEVIFVQSMQPPTITPERLLPAPSHKDIPYGPPMVYIKGGTFDMGSNEGESDEKPVHAVTVSSFSMARHETTVSEFAEFIADSGYQTDAEKQGSSSLWNSETKTFEKRDNINWRYGANGTVLLAREYTHPVVHVSHNDALAYCNWLSKKTKLNYRLPTEAEWEYASGNGASHTKYSWGDGSPLGKVANVADNTFKKTFDGKFTYSSFDGYEDGYAYTAPVESFKSNSLGLYDMTGNVWEWCSDWYGTDYYAKSSSTNPTGPATGSYRVLRGGSWSNYPSFSRVAYRYDDTPGYRDSSIGFRVVSPQ